MKRVLIVDVHNLFRQVLVVLLEHHTDLQENVHAGSLAEAYRVLNELDCQVDLAVVNLDLTEGDATELIEDLRELDVPVLAFTSRLSLERRASALRAGASEVLTTATSAQEILDTAKRLIRG